MESYGFKFRFIIIGKKTLFTRKTLKNCNQNYKSKNVFIIEIEMMSNWRFLKNWFYLALLKYILHLLYKVMDTIASIRNQFGQHPLKRRPDHRKVATSQTSELVGKAPKTCNSYPDAIFK